MRFIQPTTLLLVALCSILPATADNNSTNSTSAPTSVTSPSPSSVPSNVTNAPTSSATTEAPSFPPAPTSAPSHHITPAPSHENKTVAPTEAPTSEPSHAAKSIGKVIGRAVGWLLLIGLGTIAFGALMSNRYRIFYALKGLWYTILRLGCTRKLVQKFRDFRGRGGGDTTSSLNEIIFDHNDLSEGLLLNDNNT